MNKQNAFDTIILFTRFQHNLEKYTSLHSENGSKLSINPNLSSILDEIIQSPTIKQFIVNKSKQEDRMSFEPKTTKKSTNCLNAFENKDIQKQMQRDINSTSFNQCSTKNLHLFFHSFNEFILLKEYISSLLFTIIKNIVSIALNDKRKSNFNNKHFILAKQDYATKYKEGFHSSTYNEIITNKITTPKTQKRFLTIDEYAKLAKKKIRKSHSEVFIQKKELKHKHKQSLSLFTSKFKPLPIIASINNYPLDTNANSINIQSILQNKVPYRNFDNLSSNLNKKVKEQLTKRILTVQKNNASLSQRTMKTAVSYNYFPLFSSFSKIKTFSPK